MGPEPSTLKGHIDSDFARDNHQIKSTTAYFFTLVDNSITWGSQFQSIVTLSSTKVKYVAIT